MFSGVAHWKQVVVRRLSQGVDDFEGRGLLPFDAGGVDGVDQKDRVVLSQFARHVQASVEVAVDLDQLRAVGDGL